MVYTFLTVLAVAIIIAILMYKGKFTISINLTHTYINEVSESQMALQRELNKQEPTEQAKDPESKEEPVTMDNLTSMFNNLFSGGANDD